MSESRYDDAVRLFRAALQIERQRPEREPDSRYLSYYGLGLALARARALPIAVDACERALRGDPGQPVLLLNLGRVHALAGDEIRALECFQRGATLAPGDRVLRRELARLDRRGEPLLERLGRAHPLNRWAGRLRAAFVPTGRRSAA